MERSTYSGRTAITNVPTEFALSTAFYGVLIGVIAVLPLIVLGWQSMLVNCVAVFVGLKHSIWTASPAARRPATTTERAAFYFLWPGMDAAAFLGAKRAGSLRPAWYEWAGAILKTAIAAVGLWVMVPMLAGFPAAVVGMAGMLGAILLIHCGLFHVLALASRTNGHSVRPIMSGPLLANSLADFWSRRWNLAFRDAVALVVFRPMARRWGIEAAALATFLFSGIVHDAAISLPARGGYGLPTLYFLLQYFGLVVERRFLRGGGRWKRLATRLLAAAFVVAPLPLLFHQPFAERVIVPLIKAVGILGFIGGN